MNKKNGCGKWDVFSIQSSDRRPADLNTEHRTLNTAFALITLFLLGAGTLVALGADGPAALYHGGTRDGYNLNTQIITTEGPRKYGGARDGYARGAALNTKMKQPAGTVVMMR